MRARKIARFWMYRSLEKMEDLLDILMALWRTTRARGTTKRINTNLSVCRAQSMVRHESHLSSVTFRDIMCGFPTVADDENATVCTRGDADNTAHV